MVFEPTLKDYEDALYKLEVLLAFLDFAMEFMVQHWDSDPDSTIDLTAEVRQRVEVQSDEILGEHREELDGLYVQCERCGSVFLARSGSKSCTRPLGENEVSDAPESEEDPFNPSPHFFDGLTCRGRLEPLTGTPHVRAAANWAALDHTWVVAWEVLDDYKRRTADVQLREAFLSAELVPNSDGDDCLDEEPPALMMTTAEITNAINEITQRESEWLKYRFGQFACVPGRLTLIPRGNTPAERYNDYLQLRDALWAAYLGMCHEIQSKCEHIEIPKRVPRPTPPTSVPDSMVRQEVDHEKDQGKNSHASSQEAAQQTAVNTFRLVDGEWEITFDGWTIHPKDTMGLQQWHVIISAKGKAVPLSAFPYDSSNARTRVSENLRRFQSSLRMMGRRHLARHLRESLHSCKEGFSYRPAQPVEWLCEAVPAVVVEKA